RRGAEQRDELASFHCPMPPVPPTERIAQLGTADCCIHPPGRNEMITITPPKIFFKEVAQKQATPFPRQDLLTARNRFSPNFRAWGLDENLKPKSPPYPGPHIKARRQRQNGSAGFQPSSFEMRWTVPVPIPSDLATFKMPTPFASCFRTLRSVALSIFGRPSFTPCAIARLSPALIRWRIIVRSNSAKAPVSWNTSLPICRRVDRLLVQVHAAGFEMLAQETVYPSQVRFIRMKSASKKR